MRKDKFKSEILINKVNKILKKIQNDPAVFENIFTQLFEEDFRLSGDIEDKHKNKKNNSHTIR